MVSLWPLHTLGNANAKFAGMFQLLLEGAH